MGRKKGKQSLGFISKSARAAFVRSALSVSCENGAFDEPEFQLPVVPRRPSLRYETLSSQHQGPISEVIASEIVIDPPSLAFVEKTFVPPCSSLAELCSDTIALNLSSFENDACTRLAFSMIPPHLLSRISAVASEHRELNDRNVQLLFSSSVKELTLHGRLSKESICHLNPEISNTGSQCENENEVNPNVVPDCWEQCEVCSMLTTGCLQLCSLDISSEFICGCFIVLIAGLLPGLEKLCMTRSTDLDGTSSDALATAVPTMTHLKHLDLSLCTWFDDWVLERILMELPLLPFQDESFSEVHSSEHVAGVAASFADSHRLLRPRLRRLVCRGSGVTMSSNFLTRVLIRLETSTVIQSELSDPGTTPRTWCLVEGSITALEFQSRSTCLHSILTSWE
jgi:hypothetical protein